MIKANKTTEINVRMMGSDSKEFCGDELFEEVAAADKEGGRFAAESGGDEAGVSAADPAMTVPVADESPEAGSAARLMASDEDGDGVTSALTAGVGEGAELRRRTVSEFSAPEADALCRRDLRRLDEAG